MIEGKVIYLSADAVAEQIAPRQRAEHERRGADSYVVRVRLDEDGRAQPG